MAKAKEIQAILPNDALPDADWADAWQIVVSKPFQNSRDAANGIISNFPKWTTPMLVLRQIMVFPFGLKGTRHKTKVEKIGIFPIISETKNSLVAGIDDNHLDFRIVVDLVKVENGQSVTLTTVIHRHNLLGKLYLMVVMPFHRAIIQSALNKLLK